MLTKTLQVCTIFAFCIVRMHSISITSIVRFKCDNWIVRPSQGCVGTYILPTVVLTTSFCADNCQSIGNLRIIGTFVHTHYRNYVHGRNFIARNDIALVVTPLVPRRRKLVKLSALDTISTLGLKALIPIMDDNKPRLQVAHIENCYKEQPFGYYVCATNKITKQSIKVCQERQEQGVPLLLEDKIFGIMGITDTDSCRLSQRSFTAITPALYWISETVKNLGYTKEVISTLHDGDIHATIPSYTYHFEPSTTKVTTSSRSTSTPPQTTIATEYSDITAHQTNISYFTTVVPLLDPVKNELEHIDETTMRSAHYVPNLRNFQRKPDAFRNKLMGLRDLFVTVPKQTITTSVPKNLAPIMRERSAITTKDDVYKTETAITFIPSPTVRTKATSKTTLVTHQTVPTVTTPHTVPFFKLTADNKTTNVMDWFNVMVKDKLKKNPSMFYVISSSTTSTTTRRPTDFIDLT